jgi:N-acetylglucosamine kinase-like BadF-type ATPase
MFRRFVSTLSPVVPGTLCHAGAPASEKRQGARGSSTQPAANIGSYEGAKARESVRQALSDTLHDAGLDAKMPIRVVGIRTAKPHVRADWRMFLLGESVDSLLPNHLGRIPRHCPPVWL